MVGRFWSFVVEPARTAEVESCLAEIALPVVRRQVGCQAVFALREPREAGRYGWFAFWVSRKAMEYSLASREWSEISGRLKALGVSLEETEARRFETIAAFVAGASPGSPV